MYISVYETKEKSLALWIMVHFIFHVCELWCKIIDNPFVFTKRYSTYVNVFFSLQVVMPIAINDRRVCTPNELIFCTHYYTYVQPDFTFLYFRKRYCNIIDNRFHFFFEEIIDFILCRYNIISMLNHSISFYLIYIFHIWLLNFKFISYKSSTQTFLRRCKQLYGTESSNIEASTNLLYVWTQWPSSII